MIVTRVDSLQIFIDTLIVYFSLSLWVGSLHIGNV